MTYAVRTKSAARTGDEAEALIHAHLPLVARIAWHVHGVISSGVDREDLVQTGMVALVEAAQRYEDRGLPFSAYAAIRIKGAMIDHLRRGSPQSRTAAASRRAIEAARSALESTQAGPASAVAIAAAMQVPLETFYRMEREATSGFTESLDSTTLGGAMDIADDRQDQAEFLSQRIDEERLRDALLALDERARMVLSLYFFEEMNLKEIGLTLGVSGPRVCQIKSAALAALQAQLAEDALPVLG